MHALPSTRAFVAALAVSRLSATTTGCVAARPVSPQQRLNDNVTRNVRLLLTTDEHGWLVPLEDKKRGIALGGVVEIYDRFVQNERLGTPNVAVLSAGDMWTGPYESTLLEGRSMVESMNRMGYAAAAIGNHEFDFGQNVLATRHSEAKFPFLAANLKDAKTGATPAWAKPFVVIEVGGIRLGVLGLANIDSRTTADPRHMEGIEFLPYAATLETWVPQLRAQNVDEVIVLMHDRPSIAVGLTPVLRKLGAHVVAAGHAHPAERVVDRGAVASVDDDLIICDGGAFLRTYCRVDLTFKGSALATGDATIVPVERRIDEPVRAPDAVLAGVVANAKAVADRTGGEVLIESQRPITRGDGALGQLVVDAWLAALPYAQVALTNAGGLRQDLDAGPVRVRDVVSVMPFNNTLVVVDITGAQLREALSNPQAVIGGARFTYRGGKDAREVVNVVDDLGRAIAPEARVKVIVNDFMYRGGDHFRFESYDTKPDETAVDWRDPVMKLLRATRAKGRTLDVTPDNRATRLP